MNKRKNKNSIESNKINKSDFKNEKKTTKFMLWCIKNKITQRKLRKDTNLSIGTIQATWYKGRANASTIKLISLVYNLDEEKVKKMISEFDETNPLQD
jgi:hypothetical protein